MLVSGSHLPNPTPQKECGREGRALREPRPFRTGPPRLLPDPGARPGSPPALGLPRASAQSTVRVSATGKKRWRAPNLRAGRGRSGARAGCPVREPRLSQRAPLTCGSLFLPAGPPAKPADTARGPPTSTEPGTACLTGRAMPPQGPTPDSQNLWRILVTDSCVGLPHPEAAPQTPAGVPQSNPVLTLHPEPAPDPTGEAPGPTDCPLPHPLQPPVTCKPRFSLTCASDGLWIGVPGNPSLGPVSLLERLPGV